MRQLLILPAGMLCLIFLSIPQNATALSPEDKSLYVQRLLTKWIDDCEHEGRNKECNCVIEQMGCSMEAFNESGPTSELVPLCRAAGDCCQEFAKARRSGMKLKEFMANQFQPSNYTCRISP